MTVHVTCSRCGQLGHGKGRCVVAVLVLDDSRGTVGEEFREAVRKHRKRRRVTKRVEASR